MTTYETRYSADPYVDRGASPGSLRRPIPDRIRWGAVWAGLTTAIAVFALLQLTFFATDAVSLDVNPDGDAETTLPFWTGLAGAVGFLLGGVVTGASSRWRRMSDGILHGVILWAVATLGLLLVAGLAAGSLTSSLGGTFGELADLRARVADGATLTDAELDDARDAAAAGVLLLGIMFVATVIGTVIGTKMWPRRGDTDVLVDADRTRDDADDWRDRPVDERPTYQGAAEYGTNVSETLVPPPPTTTTTTTDPDPFRTGATGSSDRH